MIWFRRPEPDHKSSATRREPWGFGEWSQPGSNRRPPACKADEWTPWAEPCPHVQSFASLLIPARVDVERLEPGGSWAPGAGDAVTVTARNRTDLYPQLSCCSRGAGLL